MRNGLCFQGELWRGMEQVFTKLAQMLRSWNALIKDDKKKELEVIAGEMEKRGARAPRIGWSIASTTTSSWAASPSDGYLHGYRAAESMTVSTHTSAIDSPIAVTSVTQDVVDC